MTHLYLFITLIQQKHFTNSNIYFMVSMIDRMPIKSNLAFSEDSWYGKFWFRSVELFWHYFPCFGINTFSLAVTFKFAINLALVVFLQMSTNIQWRKWYFTLLQLIYRKDVALKSFQLTSPISVCIHLQLRRTGNTR